MSKSRYVSALALLMLVTVAFANSSWYQFSMETESGVTPLTSYSGASSQPTLNALMLVIGCTILVISLSTGSAAKWLAAFGCLLGLAPGWLAIQSYLNASTIPAGLQAELERLTGIAANHSESGVFQELTIFPLLYLVAELGLVLLFGIGVTSSKKWPKRVKSSTPEEPESDDPISIWDSQRKPAK
jgi:hypothetical protein